MKPANESRNQLPLLSDHPVLEFLNTLPMVDGQLQDQLQTNADVLSTLTRYPEYVEQAAVNRAPHVLVHYLRELANVFHTYYNAQIFIVEDATLRNARLALVLGVQQVLRNGLTLLGVSAPESM